MFVILHLPGPPSLTINTTVTNNIHVLDLDVQIGQRSGAIIL